MLNEKDKRLTGAFVRHLFAEGASEEDEENKVFEDSDDLERFQLITVLTITSASDVMAIPFTIAKINQCYGMSIFKIRVEQE